jgi:amidase
VSAELLGRSASELTQDLAARRIRATELMAACLARIEEVNPALNAICTVDGEAALAAAADCDRRLESGASPRALEGMPFFAKDNLATKGVRTTFGAVPFADHVPWEDAICVERLKAAGAILLGKTNTPEFAHDVNTTNRLFGTTRNPWNPNVTAGGSSGGTGSAVAAAMAARPHALRHLAPVHTSTARDPTGSDARERRGRPTRLGGPRRGWERPVEAARAGRSPR